jgi:hypothetical protein
MKFMRERAEKAPPPAITILSQRNIVSDVKRLCEVNARAAARSAEAREFIFALQRG